MIALFAIRALQSETMTKFEKASIVFAMIILCCSLFFLQQNGYGFSALYNMVFITHDLIIGDDNSRYVHALTWNIAAVYNNPFEYWITQDDAIYDSIMKNVSSFIDDPGPFDIPIHQIFTETMFSELEHSMTVAGWTGVNETRLQWENHYRNRKTISEFIKDADLRKKRFTLLPDQLTNTVLTVNGILMRPTVVNCYDGGDLSSISSWWTQWQNFMFEQVIIVERKGEKKKLKIRDLLRPISIGKNPHITEEEAAISIQLQVLCEAIYDAILVNMMNILDKFHWQTLRGDVCDKMHKWKHVRTMDILSKQYSNFEIHFLQEVSTTFIEFIKKASISSLFDVFCSAYIDDEGDENNEQSIILLKKNLFYNVSEVTHFIQNEYLNNKDIPINKGDLFAITAISIVDDTKYLLATFHGDHDGLATIPIVDAVYKYSYKHLRDHKLIFGMDANTYLKPAIGQQSVETFSKFLETNNLETCFGQYHLTNFTTFHTHTHLRTHFNNRKQQNEDKESSKTDHNPKDVIIFSPLDFELMSTFKDNTGELKYIDNIMFPTHSFPSHHGIVSTVLKIIDNDNIDDTLSVIDVDRVTDSQEGSTIETTIVSENKTVSNTKPDVNVNVNDDQNEEFENDKKRNLKLLV